MIEYPAVNMEDEDQDERLNIGVQDNEEGVIIVEEDNIVSEEEYFVENEEEEDINNVSGSQEEPNVDEIVVANIDDENDPEPEQSLAESRPRRTNAGVSVERIQMDFTGKRYGARREFNFVINGKSKKIHKETMSQQTYIQMATDILFTQMSANKGFKNMDSLLLQL